ncbi:MAG: CBS domain-containing protein [Woeseiaceae bacterium]
MMELDTIMTTDVITIGVDDNLNAARKIMHDKRIRHLPVVDAEGQVAGLVTITDVLAATDSFLRDDDSKMHPEQIPVKDVMVSDVITVDEHAGIRQAAIFLEKHRIGCLPVVTDGELRGIVTDTDFVGVAINVLEQMETAEDSDFEYEEVGF